MNSPSLCRNLRYVLTSILICTTVLIALTSASYAQGTTENPRLVNSTYDLGGMALSPSGDSIAFHKERANTIQFIDSDGSNERTIALPIDLYPVGMRWSHDESSVFFSANGIWEVDADGSNLTKVVDGVRCFALSPDGSEIVYSTEGTFDLWISEADGSSPVQLLSSSELQGTVSSGIDWSSSSDTIAFAKHDGEGTDIWTVNCDGSDLTRLTNYESTGIRFSSRPRYSPTGDRIAYSTSRYEGGVTMMVGGGIWVMDADGSNKVQFTFREAIDPQWFSDETGFAYWTEYDGIYVLDLTLDADDDGLSWNDEILEYGTSPTEADSDADGLSDGVEISVFSTDPLKADSDNDGISDGLEAVASGLSADVEVLDEGWIRVSLFWSDYTMNVETSSTVLGVTFDSEAQQLSVNVEGSDGTQGECDLSLPRDLVSTVFVISVYLDGQSIGFLVTEDESHYYVHAEYHHSLRELQVHFPSSSGPEDDTIQSDDDAVSSADEDSNGQQDGEQDGEAEPGAEPGDSGTPVWAWVLTGVVVVCFGTLTLILVKRTVTP